MQFLINIHSLLPDESERARGARSLQAVSRVKSANERPFRERKREREEGGEENALYPVHFLRDPFVLLSPT